MEKKNSTSEKISEVGAGRIPVLEKRIQFLSAATAVLAVWSVFLTFRSFSGGGVGKAQIEAAKAERMAAASNQTASGQEAIKPTTPMVPAVDPATATEMVFQENVFDFGTIKEGEKVTHVYRYKNTGKRPLIITDARGSCGCTVPEYKKEPLQPGEEAEMKVVFDSNGKVGSQSKTVTISANTIPAETILTIKGEVIGKDNSAPTAKGGK